MPSDSEIPEAVPLGAPASSGGEATAIISPPEPSPEVGAEAGRGGGEPPLGGMTAPNRRGRPGPARRSNGRWLTELVVIVVIALVVAVVLRTFVVQTFFIPSRSMVPTLQVGDRILVNKLSYHLHGVDRGDIVVFARPPLEAGECVGPPVPDLVKRVVGLPGETISLDDGQVEINGKVLAEPWLPKGTVTSPGPGQINPSTGKADPPYDLLQPYKIPAGEYFMMGDNRSDSCDSRYWGPIPESLMVGKADVRIWPLSRFTIF